MFKLHQKNSRSAFTLIEVIMSVGILVVLSIAASNLMRNSFDIRFSLSESSGATQRANTAMIRVSDDLQHLFFISEDDTERITNNRAAKTFFKVDKFQSDKLYFTTMSHSPMVQNAKESEVVFVKYEVKEDPQNPGVSHLYRGFTALIPEDVEQDIPMQILAKNIKSLSLKLWDGERWSGDRWDSTISDKANKVPHMIQFTLEAWVGEPELTTSGNAGNVIRFNTIVYPAMAASHLTEVKKGLANLRWY